MLLVCICELLVVNRMELFSDQDGGRIIFSSLPFHPQLVPNFSGADQNAPGIAYFCIRQNRQKTPMREILDWRVRIRMPQHAFWGKKHQRLAPVTQSLSSKQMEILRSI